MTHEGLSELQIEVTVSWGVTPCSSGGNAASTIGVVCQRAGQVVRCKEKGTEVGRLNEALLFYLEDGSNT